MNLRILLLLIMLGAAFAASASLSVIEQKMNRMIELFKDPDEKAIQVFAANNLDRELLDAYPLKGHVDFFRQTAAEMGDFEVLDVDYGDPFGVYLDIQTKGEDKPKRYLIEFNPQSPHGLTGMQRSPYVSYEGLQVSDTEQLHQTLQKMADNNEFSGSLLIAKDDRVVFAKAYGYADKRYGIRNTLETRFNLASITKDFTALSVLQLAQVGKLSLDDKIGKYIPELPESKGQVITIRHLLRHESGLSQYFFDPEFMKLKHRMNNIEDYVDILKDDELLFEPGTSQEYSNSGFELLAVIVQRVSGADYYDYVRENIFAKAGMSSSDFIQPTLVQQNLAKHYTNLSPLGPDEGFVRETLYLFPSIGSASGGAISNVPDMMKYMKALEQGSFLDERHQALFLNRFRAPSGDFKAVGHAGAGGAPGVNTYFVVNFEKGIKLVILSNFDERLAENIAVHLYKQLKNG